MKSPQIEIKDGSRDALRGPIQLKDPRSPEFAAQQLYWIKTLFSARETTQKDWDDAIRKAEQHRIYERVPSEQRYGSLDEMLRAEIGYGLEDLRRSITTRERMQEAAKATTGQMLLRGSPTGANQYKNGEAAGSGEEIGGPPISSLSSPASQAERARENGVSERTQRILDHLAKKAKKLHAKVVSGELSVTEAAVQAGLELPRFHVYLDIDKASKTLLEKFGAEDCRHLIQKMQALLDQELKE